MEKNMVKVDMNLLNLHIVDHLTMINLIHMVLWIIIMETGFKEIFKKVINMEKVHIYGKMVLLMKVHINMIKNMVKESISRKILGLGKVIGFKEKDKGLED